MTVSALLAQHAREQGDRLAVTWRDQKLTYSQLDEAASRAGARMYEMGIRPGDVVALLVPNIPPFLVAYFGIQKLGAVALPVNLLLKPPEVAYILNDAKAKMIVVWDMMLPVARAIQAEVPSLANIVVIGQNQSEGTIPFSRLVSGDPSQLPEVNTQENDLATLLYTSGTTGQPKGAMLTQANLLHQGRMISNAFDFTADERSLLVLPLFHVFGLCVVMMGTLAAGSSVVLQEKFDPDAVLRGLTEQGVTLMFAVPTMYIALLQLAAQGSYALPTTLRACLCGAAPLPVETTRQFEAAFKTTIVEGYGLTEATGATSVNPWRGPVKVGCIGPAIPGNEMKLVDKDGRDVGPGGVGEIAIRGGNVFAGYLNQPEATAQTFRDGWFCTGDMAALDADGYFTIIDRKKDLIIVGGENVYPREVEEVLYTFPGVVEAAVVGIPHPKMVEVPKAVVVLAPDCRATVEEIIAFLEERLAYFKVPRTIEFREALPKSGAGKILRRMLRE